MTKRSRQRPTILYIIRVVMIIRHRRQIRPKRVTFFTLLPIRPPGIRTFFFVKLIRRVGMNIPGNVITTPRQGVLLNFQIRPRHLDRNQMQVLGNTRSIHQIRISNNIRPRLIRVLRGNLMIQRRFHVPKVTYPTIFTLVIDTGTLIKVHPIPIRVRNNCHRQRVFHHGTLRRPWMFLLDMNIMTTPPRTRNGPKS